MVEYCVATISDLMPHHTSSNRKRAGTTCLKGQGGGRGSVKSPIVSALNDEILMDFKVRQNKVSVRPVLRVCGKTTGGTGGSSAERCGSSDRLPGTLSFFA